ncbi:BREX-1 system adenine-specific DNA-methyltransferase PglX, partial [Lactiplantibacillus plantarum]|uniref:BREX-1 system adenine-specific DNA-methyltransferase PglX n=1 Tax=Lactiplantibacillus plantarum TaxID=1590 RepID=UPI003EB87676
KNVPNDGNGTYIKLSAFKGGMNVQRDKVLEAIANPDIDYLYRTNQANFKKIPGSPIAYWASSNLYSLIERSPKFGNAFTTRAGMITGNNNQFIRHWFEISYSIMGISLDSRNAAKESIYRWFPYNKGGDYRRWYGNNDYVVNWENDGLLLRTTTNDKGKIPAHAFNLDYIFQEQITWSSLSSKTFSARLSSNHGLFDASGSFAAVPENSRMIMLGFLNSNVVNYLLGLINPTLNFQKGNVDSLPLVTVNKSIKQNINSLVTQNINLSSNDWNVYENSWDFKVQPLLLHIADDKQTEVGGRLENAFAIWKTEAQDRFDQLKANEEELNRIFIDLYGLNDELTPEVEDKEVSVRRADEERDIKSLLSYFIGLVFGRYSLDTPGLAYAGGEWNTDKYQKFVPNKDNLLLLNDDRYFDDDRDIMNRFRTFLAVTFGEEHVQENMDYIAYVIGKKADNSEQAIRKYFVDDFFKDHKKGYQKRPIYWEFNSGKQNGLKALMYLHRYDEGELAMMRTDYMYPLQSRYEERIEKLQQWVQDESVTKTKKQLEKKLKHVTQQLKELKQYDPIVRHVADQRINLDLDDGVLVNYEKLQDGNKILSKI